MLCHHLTDFFEKSNYYFEFWIKNSIFGITIGTRFVGRKKTKKNAIWSLKVELKIVSLKKRKEISWKQPEKDNKIIIERSKIIVKH